MEKINSMNLAQKIEAAQEKIMEGQAELSGLQGFIEENLDVFAHEASIDYMSKLNADLKVAVDGGNTNKAREILEDIDNHKKSMEGYASKARENVGDYIDGAGKVSVEKFEKQMDAFMQETLAIWYVKDVADKVKSKMLSKPLSEMDYKAMRENDSSKFGEYSVNPDRTGTNYIEKKEMPKIKKILDMKEFIGKPRSEVMKTVVEKYGADYRIPDMEDEQYILSLPADKVPKEMKDGNYYYFVGSTLRNQDGNAITPCVDWDGDKLDRYANYA